MKSRNRLFSFIVLINLVFVAGSFVLDAQGGCDPQCVPYARANSNVNLNALPPTYYANTLPEAANRSHDYEIKSKPKKGYIMVIDTSNPEDHVIAIQDSDKKDDGKYSLKITHSNYTYKASGKCDTESNIKATYNKNSKTIKFKSGRWDEKKFNVIAIIGKK